MELRVAKYPEKAREPVLWLAAFVRNKCNREISVLQEACKKANISDIPDYTTFNRILIGTYFKVDEVTGRVQGSVNNLLKIVETLRELDRYEEDAGKTPFIETPTWTLISNSIDKARLPQRINKFAGIAGPTGSQKTACFKEYKARNNHGKVVYTDAPETSSLPRYTYDLAAAYFGKDGLDNSTARNIRRISNAVNPTKCIIVDNVQRLYIERMGNDQPVFNFLQKLQDDTGCTVILGFVPLFIRTLSTGVSRGYFEQFVGRMGGLRKILQLPEKPTRDDILAIAEGFKLRDAEKHIKYLETIAHSPGLIRPLFEDLQDAKAEAEADKKPLTIDYIRMVRGEEEAA